VRFYLCIVYKEHPPHFTGFVGEAEASANCNL